MQARPVRSTKVARGPCIRDGVLKQAIDLRSPQTQPRIPRIPHPRCFIACFFIVSVLEILEILRSWVLCSSSVSKSTSAYLNSVRRLHASWKMDPLSIAASAASLAGAASIVSTVIVPTIHSQSTFALGDDS